jgi:UDP-2-acetamido-2-deoxy-ribo-hexuluronate aminotransferase
VYDLEDALLKYVGVKHAVSCASGTDALLMALMANDTGQGDAVFTTPFNFIATAEVVSLLGATPVFVDIDLDTFNISPQKLEHAIQQLSKSSSEGSTLRPKAIIAVDLFGLTADYDAIRAIAQKHHMIIIEDAAQSFGADYKDKISCTSFFPAKPLGCYGDGGMCFTDDSQIEAKLKSIRVHGQGEHKYNNVRIGINGRLDTLQAAILLAKFEIFAEEIKLRQDAALRYEMLLSPISVLKIPSVPEGYKSAWAQYSILAQGAEQRALLQSALNQEKIPTAVYYPKPLHLQEAFSFLPYSKGDFPVSEKAAERIFSLPMHPYLKLEDQEKIAHILRSAI